MPNPSYFRPLIPNGQRRAPWHNYRSRCIYLITINPPRCVPTHLGQIIAQAISDLKTIYPFISILRRSIMPDHVHFVIFVKESTPFHLGQIIATLKENCSIIYSQRFSRQYIDENVSEMRFFEEGYHDRILRGKNQLQYMLNYVSENPRRRMERLQFGSFYRRSTLVDDMNTEYEAYGNIHMIEDPEISAVKISRRYTSEELRKYKTGWLRTIQNGGVLVSPFISHGEKRVLNWAKDNGGRIILIINDRFTEKYSPKGELHQLCKEGRLLIISSPSLTDIEENLKRQKLDREDCNRMNELAVKISDRLLKQT